MEDKEQSAQPMELQIPSDLSARAIELGVGMGDFTAFSPADTVRYLSAVCLSLKLNPLTLPIRIMEIDGRKVMYATSECAAQLRSRDCVTIKTLKEGIENGCYVVRVQAALPNGRTQENIGAVSLLEPAQVVEWVNRQRTYKPNPRAGKMIEGQAFANAIMKAFTKASRRATLAICGLGLPDEPDEDLKHLRQAQVESVVTTENAQERSDQLKQLTESTTPANNGVVSPSQSPGTPVPSGVVSGAGEPKGPELESAAPPPAQPAVAPATTATATPPQPPAVTGSGAAASILPQDLVDRLEAVFLFKSPSPDNVAKFKAMPAGEVDENVQRQMCIAFLVERRQLVKVTSPLNTIRLDYANKIITSPHVFHRNMIAWAQPKS